MPVQAALPPGKRCHTEVVEAQVFWPAEEMHRAPHAHHSPTPRPVTASLVACSCRVRCVLAQSNTCRRAAGSAARSRRARAARIASAATADGRHACRRGVYVECACAARLTDCERENVERSLYVVRRPEFLRMQILLSPPPLNLLFSLKASVYFHAKCAFYFSFCWCLTPGVF